MATLTFVYADSTAVIGPLAPSGSAGGYDLCSRHAGQLSVPIGWEVIRLAEPTPIEEELADDDLMALADAIREIGFGDETPADNPSVVELGRRGHLRVIADISQSMP